MKNLGVILGLLLVIEPGFCQQKTSEVKTFKNPVLTSGADPWIIQKEGFYYYTNTSGSRLFLRKVKNLDDLKTSKQKTIWIPLAGTSYSKEIWAPELHFIRGK
jgi:GH43 family beta-xylosidase